MSFLLKVVLQRLNTLVSTCHGRVLITTERMEPRFNEGSPHIDRLL